jgi:hypothetical protein
VSQTLLFSIGVVVFAMTVVGAMSYGRYAFGQIYDAQVAEARDYKLFKAAQVASTPLPDSSLKVAGDHQF